jgi:UDP-N-acetylmuramate--alanine ligase
MLLFQVHGEKILMRNFHFIGVGGIGMSALASAAIDCGFTVSGSDRGAGKVENAPVINALAAQGIKIYPQDGSRFTDNSPLPDAIVYSTAIEEDNPDFLAAGKNIPRLHRAEFLKLIIETYSDKISIAVTGSCGKSSVTGYLTEVLERLGGDPVMISGAVSKRYRTPENAGNFRSGKGKFLVFEADESDKSLLSYPTDYAIILNIATDHYSKEELVEVFSTFLNKNTRHGAVATPELSENSCTNCQSIAGLKEYISGKTPQALFDDGKTLDLPAPGRHVALNALAIRKLLAMLNFNDDDVLEALSHFDGVWRRNDLAGMTASGARVYDDYAHNPEKILSCLSGMREITEGKILAVFQPHGYKPFGFMEEELFKLMDNFLKKDDRFILLEPFYAGGTSSFSPHAEDVCRKWQTKSAFPERFMVMPDRETLKEFLLAEAESDDTVVIMGARDNSLSLFAVDLTL